MHAQAQISNFARKKIYIHLQREKEKKEQKCNLKLFKVTLLNLTLKANTCYSILCLIANFFAIYYINLF